MRFGIHVNCLCGGHLDGRPVSDTGGDTQRVVVYRCATCGKRMALQLTIRPTYEGERQAEHRARTKAAAATVDQRCGTDQGWKAHQYRKETACGPCREAHARRMAAWRDNRKAAVA